METKGKIRIALWMTAVLLITGAAAMAQQEVREGFFQVDLYSPEQISWNPDLNSGFANTWYRYPQPPSQPLPWWNEWFWNDPYIKGGKWIQVSFDYKLLNPEMPGYVSITINWTNGLWVGQAAPPTWQNSTDPELYIERLSESGVYWNFQLDPGSPAANWNSGVYWLPIDYNPEWVSVDVQGLGNVGIWNGVLLHQCVPEPATLMLLAFGGWVMFRNKKA